MDELRPCKDTCDIEFMFMNYVKKVIVFSKKQYKRKSNNFIEHEKLILNNTSTNFNEEDIYNVCDLSIDKDFISISHMDMENAFSDKKLYEIFKDLTPKQKYVLFMKSIEDMTDQKIAERLNVTRQGVSKIRNAALKRILNSYAK